jgi:hypothetical protein
MREKEGDGMWSVYRGCLLKFEIRILLGRRIGCVGL